jgi:hypothetical protein
MWNKSDRIIHQFQQHLVGDVSEMSGVLLAGHGAESIGGPLITNQATPTI